MKVLFVTRKYPPSVGGLETAAYELCSALNKQATVKRVSWGGSNKALPLVYPWLTLRTLWAALFWKPDAIYLQDGLLAPLGAVVKLLTRRSVFISVHGLEVTYPSHLSQWLLRQSLPRLNHVIVGSRWTQTEVKKRFPELQTSIITYGVRDIFYSKQGKRELLASVSQQTGLDLHAQTILLTSGRLVPRKGVSWFINNALPGIVKQNPNLTYLVAGDGPDRSLIEQTIKKQNLADHVHLLGRVSDGLRDNLYNIADLFVMPNVPVANDGEGFGLVALEASSCGTPVIGADLEGVADAVTAGKNGRLVAPRDARRMSEVIVRELSHPVLSRVAVRTFTIDNYSWRQMASQYIDLFKQYTTLS